MTGRFVAGRLLQVVPTAMAILIIGFILIHIAPGDPVQALAGEHGDAAYYAFIRQRFGLDRSLPQQLATYLLRVSSGDVAPAVGPRLMNPVRCEPHVSIQAVLDGLTGSAGL